MLAKTVCPLDFIGCLVVSCGCVAYLLVASSRRRSGSITSTKASASLSSTDLSGHFSWVAAWMPTPGAFGGVIGDSKATLWAVLGHCVLLDPVS